MKYGFYINLDERGEFYADVRDKAGKTVFEVRAGGESEDESNIFEDGFMRHKNDLDGLTEYLVDLGVIPGGSKVVSMSEFESDDEDDEAEEDDAPKMRAA